MLEACAPNGACGSLDLRQVNGTGCSYELDAAPPAGDASVYGLVNAGSIDCEDAWSSSELLIRTMPTGGLAVSRVFEGAVDRSFTL
ncbi:MAG: hypothetical protein QOE66_1137, partial [Chloroflexota bacterium]|nr:hypothetical protein [Chloroflexota bacterium]